MTTKAPVKLKTLKTAEDIHQRVVALGAELTKKFKGIEPIVICVLNGSFIFYADLIRAMDLDLTCEFLGVSSYKNAKVSSGEVEVTLDLSVPLQGKDVILVEDLIDSGLTMNFITDMIQARKPKSLTTVALLVKRESLKTKCQIDFSGFDVGNEFIVGYGIDYAGEYRNLDYLATID